MRLLLALLLLPFATPALARDCAYSKATGTMVEVSTSHAEAQMAVQAAKGREWFTENHLINMGEASYEKFGLPRYPRLDELTFLASLDGVPILALASEDPEDMFYVLYSAVDCEFQPYMRTIETQN